MSKPLVVIDGDLVAYKVAAAAEERSIIAKHINGSEHQYKNRTAFKAAVPKNKQSEYTIIDVQIPDAIENVYHSLKMMSKGIAEKAGSDDFKLVISGNTNFRDNIPLPTKYKNNRKDTLRPLLLQDARQYLQHAMKAEISVNCEADDIEAIYAYDGWKNNKKIIQATIDKDARGCNGWLFNWDKDTEPKLIQGSGFLRYEDSDVYGEGHMWFLYQVLHQDKADGYRGADLSGQEFGIKAAFDILSKAKSIKHAYELVYNQYKTWYPDPVTYTAWDGKEYTKNALQIMEMYWQCARMLRWKDDNLSCQEMLDNLGIKYET